MRSSVITPGLNPGLDRARSVETGIGDMESTTIGPMPFEARVARVLIASPSDTGEARAVLRETIFDWNGVNGEAARLLFWPLMWERDAVPELGHPPQSILNRQLVDRSDAVLATFWTRLGTPTDEGASGTVEEIDRAVRAGKPVLVYFSSQPVLPDSIDTAEYERLKEFRELLRTRGLYDSYASIDELARKVTTALSRVAREKFASEVADEADVEGPRAVLVARVDREREPRVDGRGQVRYSTNWRLIIENRGSASAEDLTFELEPVGDGEPPEALEANHPIQRLAPGNDVSYHLVVVMGTAMQADVTLRWKEGDREFSEVQTIRL